MVDVWAQDEPADEDDPSIDKCGSAAVKCANLAPTTAAAAAARRPIRQVSFLTRRSPSSRAGDALEYWVRVTGIRVAGESLQRDRRVSVQRMNRDPRRRAAADG
jgi:hypothetical protein